MKSLLLFLLVFVSIGASAQKTKIKGIGLTIVDEAKKMANCLMKKDYSCFADYMHPQLISQAGGKEKFVSGLSRSMEQMQSNGTRLDSIEILKLYDIVQTDNELQATLNQLSILTVPQGKMMSKTCMIAISNDNGKHWYFIDTAGRDLKTMKKQFSNLSMKLYIPPFEKPMILGN